MESYIRGKLLFDSTYGNIYEGVCKITAQPVVMKFIKKGTELADNEENVLKQLTHPHIVRVIDIFDTATDHVLVLEKAQCDLFEFLEADPHIHLPESVIRKVFTQVLSAVEYVHMKGFIHCDIKPENVLIFDDCVKLADFGLAHPYVRGQSLPIRRGSMVYASPEAVFGTNVEGPEMDVWSLGVLLYTMVYDCHPFDIKLTPFDSYRKYEEDGLTFPWEVSSSLVDLLSKMLEPKRTKRITVHEIWNHPWLTGPMQDLIINTEHSNKIIICQSPQISPKKKHQKHGCLIS